MTASICRARSSATVILIGAELNAEIEHQTARDSTEGGQKPHRPPTHQNGRHHRRGEGVRGRACGMPVHFVGVIDNIILVVILSNMKAELIIKQRLILTETLFVEAVVWKVAPPVRGSDHTFKYRLALVSGGVCVLRYDNEVGKGEHKHVDGREVAFAFVYLDTLLDAFFAEVEQWRTRP
jgi:hypothetical protein